MLTRSFLAVLLATGVVGCGSDRERGINRDADRPRMESPAPEKGRSDKDRTEKDKAPAKPPVKDKAPDKEKGPAKDKPAGTKS